MYRDLWQFLLPLLALGLGYLWGQARHVRHQRRIKAWPSAFRLNPRPLFTTEERLLFRELKTALPHHLVLAKLNVLRFCQSSSAQEARLWFDRLQAINVTFAVCTPSGTVISVIDLEASQRTSGERQQRLKESVLETCRIRYLRCEPGQWPKPALLAQWALGTYQGDASEGETAPTPLSTARAELAEKLQKRRVERAERVERASRFHDSSFAPDSFFAVDSRFDMAELQAGDTLPPAEQPVRPPAAR